MPKGGDPTSNQVLQPGPCIHRLQQFLFLPGRDELGHIAQARREGLAQGIWGWSKHFKKIKNWEVVGIFRFLPRFKLMFSVCFFLVWVILGNGVSDVCCRFCDSWCVGFLCDHGMTQQKKIKRERGRTRWTWVKLARKSDILLIFALWHVIKSEVPRQEFSASFNIDMGNIGWIEWKCLRCLNCMKHVELKIPSISISEPSTNINHVSYQY